MGQNPAHKLHITGHAFPVAKSGSFQVISENVFANQIASSGRITLTMTGDAPEPQSGLLSLDNNDWYFRVKFEYINPVTQESYQDQFQYYRLTGEGSARKLTDSITYEEAQMIDEEIQKRFK